MEAPGKQNIAARICPSCGAQVPSESKFCLKCGREFTDAGVSAAKRSFKALLLRILPWILPILLVILVISTQSLFLTKGNAAQNGFAMVITAAGFITWITGVIAFFVQIIRRKGKRLWANIAFCSFAAMIIGISMGTYVDVSSSDKAGTSANAPTSPSSAKPTSTAATPSGSKVELARQTVPATGGTITINKPGDALNGLQITVPSGAYKTSTNFTVSYQNVKSANPDLANASPLILVENGGKLSEKPMTLKIPIKYGEDDFPMVFDYDIATGNMEPMPTKALDDNSITAVLNHFSGKLVLTAKGQYLKSQELLYLKKGSPPTKFQPGKDDWAFKNRASYITPNGNCTGMSVTAIWYFLERSKGETNRLNGQYPGRVQSIPEDDREAWRLVSTVQQDINLSEPLADTFDRPSFVSSKRHGDEVTYRSFQTAMIFTGQPQLVLMDGKDKKTGKRLDVGHAMVVYGFKDGLIVADPNDPGSPKGEHVIPYKDGNLGPYETDTDPQDAAAGTIYDTFFFGARGGSCISWQKVGAHWDEVTKKTIGDGRFPDYTLKVTDDRMGQYDIYQDALTVDRKAVTIRVDSTQSLGLRLYRDGAWVSGTPQRTITLNLKDSANLLGIYVQSQAKTPDGTNYWTWADFKWVTVTYKPGTETWTAVLTGFSSGRAFGLPWSNGETKVFSVKYDVTETFSKSLISLINEKSYYTFTGNAVMNATSSVISQPPSPWRAFSGSISNEQMDTTVGYSSGKSYILFKTKSSRYTVGDIFKMSYEGEVPGGPQIDSLCLYPEKITETSITGSWETQGNAGAVAKGTFTLTKQ